MADNQEIIILEEVVLEDIDLVAEVEIQEMIEEVEKDTMTKAIRIVTVDVADGNSCKT